MAAGQDCILSRQMSHHMAITLPLNKMPRMGPVCVHSSLRTRLQVSWASGESQRQGREAKLHTRPCPSRGFLVPPPTPPGLPGPPELQGAEPWPRGRPDRSRVDVPVRTLSRNGQLYGDTDNALEVGLSGFVQTASRHHVVAPGDGADARPSGLGGNAHRSAECELVQGWEEALGLGADLLVPRGWKQQTQLQRGPQPQATAQPGTRGSRG